MRQLGLSWKQACLTLVLFSVFACGPLRGQGTSASGVLAQLAAAFAGQRTISQVQITGTASWAAGSLNDSGPVTLTASASGGWQMQLALQATGQKTLTQTGVGSSAICQWTGNDGIAHPVALGNCSKPELWFLPALSLQPSALPSYLGIADLGTGTVGFSQNTYRHLQSQFFFSDLPITLENLVVQQSPTDLGLDPTTLLPAVLAYSLTPDSGGGSTPVQVEIHYSNYQTVNGVQIPFLIQRYVNGCLQLAIAVTSAQIS